MEFAKINLLSLLSSGHVFTAHDILFLSLCAVPFISSQIYVCIFTTALKKDTVDKYVNWKVQNPRIDIKKMSLAMPCGLRLWTSVTDYSLQSLLSLLKENTEAH